MCRLYPRLLLAAAILLAACGAHAAGVNHETRIIGRIKNVSGEVYVVSNEVHRRALPGTSVRLADTVITRSSGSVGVTLQDNTRLSLGPSSEIHMKTFVFSPQNNELEFTGYMPRGTLFYQSGYSNKTAAIETPSAVIGIRGTRFLLKVEDAPE